MSINSENHIGNKTNHSRRQMSASSVAAKRHGGQRNQWRRFAISGGHQRKVQ